MRRDILTAFCSKSSIDILHQSDSDTVTRVARIPEKNKETEIIQTAKAKRRRNTVHQIAVSLSMLTLGTVA